MRYSPKVPPPSPEATATSSSAPALLQPMAGAAAVQGRANRFAAARGNRCPSALCPFLKREILNSIKPDYYRKIGCINISPTNHSIWCQRSPPFCRNFSLNLRFQEAGVAYAALDAVSAVGGIWIGQHRLDLSARRRNATQ